MSSPQPSDDNSQRNSQGDSQRLEQIVAYLDGELEPEDSARVEQQLTADEGFRQELQSIDRAWTALDQLPSTVVDDKFLQTTMELVVDSAKREVIEKTQALPVLKRKRWLSKLLVAVAAMLLGVLAARMVVTNANQLLVADLPVIYRLDIYSQFEQLNYLRMLDREVADEDWPISKDEITKQQEQFGLVSATETRRNWLRGISDDQRVMLRANFNRFRSMPAVEQERLRSLHTAIESEQDSQQLQQILIRYEQWQNNLPASELYSLRELSPTERARQVARMLSVRQENSALRLSPRELKKFWNKIQPQMKALSERAEADLPEGARQKYRASREGRNSRELFRMLIDHSEKFQRSIQPIILEALPEDASRQFEQLPLWEKREQMFEWRRQSSWLQKHDWQAPGQSGEVLQQDLEEFFVAELEPGEKQRLLALPHDQMQRELERMFRGAPSARRWGGPPEHGRHPPPGMGPPHGPEDFRRGPRGEKPSGRGAHGRGRPPIDGRRSGPPPPPPER
jgi:hypothetical protein